MTKPPASEWKDISMAPKDGTVVLILDCPGKYNDASIDFGWLSNEGKIEEPTHFMPLPAPPKEK